MSVLLRMVHVVLVILMPVLLVGIVNRTKARWAGRQGPALLQSAWDLRRLLAKQPVYSRTSTWIFGGGAWVVLAATVLAAFVAPIVGDVAVLSFDYDFLLFAYGLGLARVLLMLSALDVGSAFEGMGAAREALFTVAVEPALFFVIGAAAMLTGQPAFAGLLGQWHHVVSFPWVAVPVVAVLFVLLQVEASRLPVDDPQTHLELTMVHEVMVLDHSGPALAALQYAAAMKLAIHAGLIAAVLNPFEPRVAPGPAVAAAVAIMAAVAIVVGCVESWMARMRLRAVPGYLMLASLAAAGCLGLAGWLARVS